MNPRYSSPYTRLAVVFYEKQCQRYALISSKQAVGSDTFLCVAATSSRMKSRMKFYPHTPRLIPPPRERQGIAQNILFKLGIAFMRQNGINAIYRRLHEFLHLRLGNPACLVPGYSFAVGVNDKHIGVIASVAHRGNASMDVFNATVAEAICRYRFCQVLFFIRRTLCQRVAVINFFDVAYPLLLHTTLRRGLRCLTYFAIYLLYGMSCLVKSAIAGGGGYVY